MPEKCDNGLMVSIRCITYNHEPYIRQCLEGFIMQKTNFRFEAIVHDDASTDGTAAIIKEYAEKYPDIIKPIFETENQYSKHDGSIRRIMNEHTRGKYVAMCEGDDYWIDPLKLQKQVDYLEKNPDYGLVYTNVDFYYQESGKFVDSYFSRKKYLIKNTFEDFLVNAWFIAPCTWMFKKSIINKLPKKNFVVGDLPLLLTISSLYKVHYINESTGVYRVLKNSASHFGDFTKHILFWERLLDIQLFYLERFDMYHTEIEIMHKWYVTSIKICLKHFRLMEALYYSKCFLLNELKRLK